MRTWRKVTSAGSILCGLSLLGAALAASRALAQEPPILAELKGPERERVAKLIEATRKEGALVYTDNILDTDSRKVMEAAFEKRYGLPQMEIKSYLFSSSGVVARVEQEIKAGKVTIDWVNVNAPSFHAEMARRGELLEDCSPEFAHYGPVGKAGLSRKPCVFETDSGVYFTIMWNPQYITDEFASWYDVLKPEYRGKVIMGDVRKAESYLDTYIALRKVLPLDFWKRLAAQKPFFLVRSNDIRNKVMTGEYPVAFFGYGPRAYQVRKDVDLRVSYPREGIALTPRSSAILAKAPHPNAARLWTDFWFSEAGQGVLLEYEAIQTGRANMPIPAEIRKFTLPLGEVKIVPMNWEELQEAERARYRQELRQIFGE